MAYSMGLNLGPGINFIFEGIDFKIANFMKINQNNAPCFFLVFISLIMIGICYFFVSDMSMEYGKLEENLEPSKESKVSKCNSDVSYMKWSDLLTFDIIILSLSTGFVRYVVSASIIYMTLIGLESFHWSLSKLSIVVLSTSLVAYGLIFFTAELKLHVGRIRSVMIYILTLIGTAIVGDLMLVGNVYEMRSELLKYAFSVVLVIIKLSCHFYSITVSKIVLMRIVPAHSASFADGFRTSISSGMRTLAYFMSAALYSYGAYIWPGLIAMNFVFIGIFILRRKSFMV